MLSERLRTLEGREGGRFTVIAEDGLVLADSEKDAAVMENHGQRPEVVVARASGEGSASRFSRTVGRPMVYVARRVDALDGRPLGYVRAALPERDATRTREVFQAVMLRAALLAIGLGLVAAFLFTRRIVRPVRELTSAAQAIAGGDYDRPLRISSRDEIGELGTAFRRMAGELEHRVEALDRERRELAAILSGMVEGVLAVDSEGRVVLANDAAATILGTTQDAMLAQPLWEGIPVRPVADALAQALERDRPEAREVRLQEPTGDRVLALRTAPIRSASGGAVVVLQDITGVRRLETVRRDFVANASHELKTPVAAIRGLVETILEDEEMPVATQRGFLERVQGQTRRLGELVEEMLALSRLEVQSTAADVATSDMRDAVRAAAEAVQPLALARDVPVDVAMPPSAVPIRTSIEALQRIVGNLLDNAVKYTEAGTSVAVALSVEHDEAVLTVRDHGPGIPEGERGRIFERFYRMDRGRSREVGGTGLGLAIVKHLASAIGGEVGVAAADGGGSRFVVRLPLVRGT